MADTITSIIIQIKADTAQAAAALKSFVSSTTGGLSMVEKETTAVGAAAEKTGAHIAGMSYYARSGIDGIRAAFEGGGTRAMFYTLDEGLRGLLFSGISLGTIVPVVGAVAAAVGAGALVWNEYKSNLVDVAADAEKLNDKFKTLAASIGLIQAAGKSGVVGNGGMDYLMGLATGNVKQNVSIPISQARGRMPEDQFEKTYYGYHQKVLQQGSLAEEPNVTVQMTPEEKQQAAMEYLERAGFVVLKKGEKGEPDSYAPTVMGKAVVDANKLKETANSPLTGTVAELQKKQKEFQDQLYALQALAKSQTGEAPTTAQNVLGKNVADAKAAFDKQFGPALAAAQQKAADETAKSQVDAAEKSAEEQNKVREENAKEFAAANKQIEDQTTDEMLSSGKSREQFAAQEYAARLAVLLKFYAQGKISGQDYADAMRQIQQGELEAQKTLSDEKLRSLQLDSENLRTAIQTEMESVKRNQLLTDQQKTSLLADYKAQLDKVTDAEIQQLEALKTQTKNLQDQLELERTIADLKKEKAKPPTEETPQQQKSFSFQFPAAITSLQNQWATWAKESADAFKNVWTSSTNAISGGLTTLFEKGAQKGQWFREIWNGIVGSMISSMTKMAVNWMMNHVIMTNATALMYAVTKMLGLEDTEFGIWCATQKAGAAATAAGTTQAVTTATAQKSIGANAATAASGAAASQAGVPYIGPILALAAMAAIMGAVMALMHGFEGGGYTGDGPAGQVAGVVHRGEYVIPASRVKSTLPLLQAIHSGSLADMAAPRAGAGSMAAPSSASGQQSSAVKNQHVTHNAVYFDKQKMVDDLAKSDAHEKFIVDVMARNIHKFT